MVTIKLYNSLSRKKEDFIPIDPNHIRIYACGPTVYSYAHIGNARMAVVFGLLADLLRTLYPKVTYVTNITDVDDKIIAAAKSSQKSCEEIAIKYANIYNDDMRALGVTPPNAQPKATEYIDQMITLIQTLIRKGHAYVAQNHVLFSVPSYPNYGKLSGRSREDQIAGARVEVAPYKKDPADFVLWKPSDTETPGWESPWGRGRPGWHIECSAMAETLLGLPFDIHGGGADLKFPHHENEIAQSCCAHNAKDNNDRFARYWVHNGFVTVENEKMAKSDGNVKLVHDLLKDNDGEALRFALLSAHYSQPLDWTQSTLQQSKKNLDRLYQVLKDTDHIELKDEPLKISNQNPVLLALCDDINTPKALAALNLLAKQTAQGNDASKYDFLCAAKLLGILQKDAHEWLGYRVETNSSNQYSDIDKLLEERQTARANKNFSRADEIRNILFERGITIEDTPQGAVWKKI